MQQIHKTDRAVLIVLYAQWRRLKKVQILIKSHKNSRYVWTFQSKQTTMSTVINAWFYSYLLSTYLFLQV